MSVNISGPQITVPSVGLRASVGSGVTYSGIEKYSTTGDRWWTEAGWNFETAPCGGLQTGGLCINPRPFAPGSPGVSSGRAINFETQVQCSTWGSDIVAQGGKVTSETFETYAKDIVSRQVFSAISGELWSGTESRASAYTGNHYLALNGSDFTNLSPGGSVSLKEGIALLDQYLCAYSPGGNSLIHVPVKLLTYIGSGGLTVDTGTSRRVSWGGNDIVGECGYAGTGPDTFANGPSAAPAGKMWIYGTGPMLVRIVVDDGPLSYIDIENNDLTTVLSGDFMFGWGCGHAGVLVDVPSS